MTISWQGLSCFEITAKGAAGEATVVFDPYDNSTGLRFPRTLEAQVACMSHDASDANNLAAVTGNPFLIKSPGEYEIRDIFFYAFSAPLAAAPAANHMIIRLEAEEMNLAHLGALDRELSASEMEKMQNIDILMIPVGGGRVLDAKKAETVISQIEPRVIIPMTYDLPNQKEKFAAVEDFCKALRVFRKEEMNKYKAARKDLPEEDTLIVVLNR